VRSPIPDAREQGKAIAAWRNGTASLRLVCDFSMLSLAEKPPLFCRHGMI